MGGSIPRTIKVEVIRKWLQGETRDQIAQELDIGAGTVSNVVQECRQNDLEFDLMRQVAVKLKNQGDSIESFGSLVRVRERLRGLLLDSIPTTMREDDREVRQKGQAALNILEDKIESLIVALEEFCFKRNLSIKEFF